MNDQKKQKLIQAIEEGKIKDDTSLAVFELVTDLEDKMDDLKEQVDNAILEVKESEVSLDKVLESVRGQKGDKGDPPTEEQLLELITPLIPEPIPGKDYVLTESDKKEIAKTIPVPIFEKIIEKTEIVKQPIITNEIRNEIKEVAMYEDGEKIVEKINRLSTDNDSFKIDASHISNLPVAEGNKVIGGRQGVQLYVDGVKKGLAQYIDIVAGPNIVVSDSFVNGLHTLTITSSGGSGGISQLAATETPDGTITTFTFTTATAQPSFVVVDNVWQKAVTATGSVNWTWNGGTKEVTLSVPAVDDIWAVV